MIKVSNMHLLITLPKANRPIFNLVLYHHNVYDTTLIFKASNCGSNTMTDTKFPLTQLCVDSTVQITASSSSGTWLNWASHQLATTKFRKVLAADKK